MSDKDELRSFLDAGGPLVVVYHWDADGICAAALVGHETDVDLFVPCGNQLDDEVAEEVLEANPDRVLVVDVGGLQPGAMAYLACSADVLVVDHHQRDAPPDGIAFIQRKEPVSLAVHRLLGGPAWIACAGTRGDKGEDYCRRAFPRGDLRLARSIMGMLNSGKNLKGRDGARVALDALRSASSPREMAEGRTPGARTLKGYDRTIEQETRRLISDVKKNGDKHEDQRLMFYDIHSDLNLSSRVSSILRWRMKGWIILVYNTSLEPVPLSARTTRKDINLVELLTEAGFSSCGGHPDAVGGITSTEELDVVTKRLTELLTK
ncbi:MAG: hypothetical protein QF415_07830 [Candidatus Undinarchaeales archaeon]|nr:hypothetical protein [Candidatus Undinarchaeales archaeon]MDP7493345.1 hypothetical protein [Candidatus Undinarchaeales archaeon]